MPVTLSDEKLILYIYYIAPVGDRTHDLPHTVASNMIKVSHALNHSATAADKVHGYFAVICLYAFLLVLPLCSGYMLKVFLAPSYAVPWCMRMAIFETV